MKGIKLFAMTGLVFLMGCAPTSQQRFREVHKEAMQFYNQGAYPEASEHFREALALRPNDPDLIYNLAACQDKMGKKDKAEELYRKALEFDAEHQPSRLALIQRRVEDRNADLAGKMTQDWLKSSPNRAGPYIMDAKLLSMQGDLDSARSRLQQALDLEPTNTRALNALGEIYEKFDRPDRAAVLYERSLAVEPEQPIIRDKFQALRKLGVNRPHPD